ncbi:MAG: hypothetical protein ACRETK_00300, partial [Steroidobacteraceae bacterium]
GSDSGYGSDRDFGGQAHEPVHSEAPVHRGTNEAPEARPSIAWSSASPVEPPAAVETRRDE